MIYRILCNGSDWSAFFLDARDKADRPTTARERLMGVYTAGVPTDWKDLRRPALQNKKARFFFTEKGWRHFGRDIAADAQRDGRTVRILRRINPAPSEIVFKDEFQVAILPRKDVARKKRK